MLWKKINDMAFRHKVKRVMRDKDEEFGVPVDIYGDKKYAYVDVPMEYVYLPKHSKTTVYVRVHNNYSDRRIAIVKVKKNLCEEISRFRYGHEYYRVYLSDLEKYDVYYKDSGELKCTSDFGIVLRKLIMIAVMEDVNRSTYMNHYFPCYEAYNLDVLIALLKSLDSDSDKYWTLLFQEIRLYFNDDMFPSVKAVDSTIDLKDDLVKKGFQEKDVLRAFEIAGMSDGRIVHTMIHNALTITPTFSMAMFKALCDERRLDVDVVYELNRYNIDWVFHAFNASLAYLKKHSMKKLPRYLRECGFTDYQIDYAVALVKVS